MTNYLNSKISKNEYIYKSQRHGQVRVMVKKIDCYRKLVKLLNSDKAKFYTFQLKQERAFRAIVKNLHSSTPCDEIRTELESLGYKVRGLNNICKRITKEPLRMFFIDLELDIKNTDNYKLKHIFNAIVNIEPPRKVNDVVQCFRCQEFRHTKSCCSKKFKCVKCSLNQIMKICQPNMQTAQEITLIATKAAKYIKKYFQLEYHLRNLLSKAIIKIIFLRQPFLGQTDTTIPSLQIAKTYAEILNNNSKSKENNMNLLTIF